MTEQPKKTSTFKMIFFAVLFLACLPFLFGYIILIAVCLMPSFVAWITDKDYKKRNTICIFSFNLAGLVPVVIKLFKTGQSFENAVWVLSDPFTWLIVLGSSMIGMIFYNFIPPIVSVLSKYGNESKIAKLNENKKILEARWGEQIVPNIHK